MVLKELAQELKAVALEARFELGVGEPSRLNARKKAADGQVGLVGGGEGAVVQLLRPSCPTSLTSPSFASLSSFWRALR